MKKTYCINCQTEFPENIEFCPKCGCYNDLSEKYIPQDNTIESTIHSQSNNSYKTNSSAEDIINITAKILLVLNLIITVCMFIYGIFKLVIEQVVSEDVIGLIVGGIIGSIVTVIIWASMKLVVNISRNLFQINATLKEIHRK